MPSPVLENSHSPTSVSNSAQELLSGSNPLLSDNVRPIRDREELMTAFEVFNSMSAQLAETYHDMEEQVGSLNNELHVVAEQRLQELKEKEQVTNRLENLLNIMPAGVVVLDSRGRVTQCNPAAEDFLGEPLLGEIWRTVIKRSFAPQVDDGHEISLKDGRRINMVTRSMNGESGQLILLTDLTETRELQHRLDRHRRLSEMGRMMSSLAHQIRTPLSAAMLYAGHLCDSDLTPEQSQRFSDKVLSRLNHLDQQVKDMLLFVKGDVKQTDTITVEELFSALEAAMEVSVTSSQAICTINNTCAATTIQCNRDTMVGALMNLVTNAIQSRPSSVEITINASIVGNTQLQLMIVDNGPGFDSKVLKSLQEPFFTTKPQGTGLGLAVVRAVTQAHHGEFDIRSESGVGTVAILTLPVLMSAASAVTVPVEPGSRSL
jgi:two-component system sensor histidine kinase FlrB|tara:strand:+ start:7443 stop:8741 length:1299 start_codon:yes stop_codon:yes gene_type:complete